MIIYIYIYMCVAGGCAFNKLPEFFEIVVDS